MSGYKNKNISCLYWAHFCARLTVSPAQPWEPAADTGRQTAWNLCTEPIGDKGVGHARTPTVAESTGLGPFLGKRKWILCALSVIIILLCVSQLINIFKKSFIVAFWIWNLIMCMMSEIYTWLYHNEWTWGKWQHYLKLPYLVMGDKEWCIAMGKISRDSSYKTEHHTNKKDWDINTAPLKTYQSRCQDNIWFHLRLTNTSPWAKHGQPFEIWVWAYEALAWAEPKWFIQCQREICYFQGLERLSFFYGGTLDCFLPKTSELLVLGAN